MRMEQEGMWAGRVLSGDSSGGCFGGTFGAFVTFG